MLDSMQVRLQVFKNQIVFLQKIIASKLYEGEVGRRLQNSEAEKEVLKEMVESIGKDNTKLRE